MVSKIVMTGGLLEWTTDEAVPEARSMFDLMSEHFGVDSADVILDSMAQNTRDNAVYTREALEAEGLELDIVLVTSAYHMPRSVAVFEKAGFMVAPAPIGYFADKEFSQKPIRWLPTVTSLLESTIALREYLGMVVYKVAGWI